MIDIFSIVEDIRFRTSLLESLEWDEDLLQTFLLYFDDKLKSNSNLQEMLTEIKDCFGEAPYKIVVNLFKEEALFVDEYLNKEEGGH